MKTKLIFLCAFLMLSCYFARGQEGMDTIGLLEIYRYDAEPEIMASLAKELEKEDQLNIENFGRYSSPFSQALENTFINFALQNREKVQLRLGYYEINLSTPEQTEEYYLQRTFAQYYPDRLLDFLELKMLQEAPVTLEDITSTYTHLAFEKLERNFLEMRQFSPNITMRTNVGLSKSSTFINGISLREIRNPAAAAAARLDDCECDFWECWWDCMDIERDFLENIVWTVCSSSCLAAGTPVTAFVCFVCISTLIGNIELCWDACEADPCTHGHLCTPGEPRDKAPRCFDGQRVREVCNCEGTAWEEVVYECPPETRCVDGVCVDCSEFDTPAPHPGSVDVELQGNGNGGNSDDTGSNARSQDEEVNLGLLGCNRTIELIIDTQNETSPNTDDGTISVVAQNGYGGYSYRWEDGTTGSSRTGLDAGEYCVTVTDLRCCVATECITLVATACEGLNWNIQLSQSPACNGDDGIITVSAVSGGEAPYSYEWSTGATGQSITGLEPGYYSVTVTDDNYCPSVSNIHLTGSTGEAPVLDGIEAGVCPSDPNSGAINLVVSSHSLIMSYEWSNGSTEQDLSGLSTGNYTVTITDECANQYSQTFEIAARQLQISAAHTSPTMCQGLILIDVENGNAPFNYLVNGPNGYSVSANSAETYYIFGGLCIGDYTINVTDSDGCLLTANQNICACPDIVYGEWTLDPAAGQYCQSYTIPASDLCEAGGGENCFTPEYGDWFFDETTDQYCRNIYCPEGAYCDGFDITQECFDPIVSWHYDEDSDQYCKEVTCVGEYYCDNLVINECFDYEQGNCSFNSDEMCECEILVEGESIDIFVSVEPEIEWDYDTDENVCLKIFYCDGNEIATFDEEPEDYEDWEYDIDDEACYRIVICSDDQETDFTQTEEDPEVEWLYDDFEEACFAYVSCDDDIWNDLEIEGETEIEWDVDQENGFDCIATVYCGFEGEDLEEIPEAEFSEDSESEYTSMIEEGPFYFCVLTYYCGDGAYEEEEEYPTSGAECGNNGDGTCTYTCLGSNLSEDGPCNPDQCPDLIGAADDRNGTTARSAISIASSISILPNPFKDEFRIGNLPLNQGDLTLDLMDSKGLRMTTIHSNQKQSLLINTAKLAEGIYFIKIYNEDRSFIQVEKLAKVN